MTTEFGDEPTLRTYFLVLRRRRWWLAAVALLCVAVSVVFSFAMRKQYSASAQVLVQSVGTPELGTSQLPVGQTDVETELQLVTSAPVVAAVGRQLGSRPTVSAAEIGQTNVISIAATSPSPSRAALIANAYANAFVRYQVAVTRRSLTAAETQLRSQLTSLAAQVKSLHAKVGSKSASEVAALLNQEAVLKEQLAQIQVNGAITTGPVELVTPAQTPKSPSSPNPVRNSLLGLAAGLILGIGAAFLRDNLDDALLSKEATERAGGAPVLAMVPSVPAWRTKEKPLVVSAADPSSPTAESYRSLRTSLQFARQERQLHSLLVTSPVSAEGKTTTIANLGTVFAQAGERVVLASCDLRRPRLGKFFGIDEQVGLVTILLGQASLEDALRPAGGNERLWVLPAGPIPPNPAELLNSAGAQQVLATLRDRFDLVLIDSPPTLAVTDAAVLSKYADGTLLVVAAGQTRRADLRRAAEKLDQVSATITGVILNQVTKQSGYSYGYGYGYEPYRARTADASAAAAHPNGKKTPAPSSSELP